MPDKDSGRDGQGLAAGFTFVPCPGGNHAVLSLRSFVSQALLIDLQGGGLWVEALLELPESLEAITASWHRQGTGFMIQGRRWPQAQEDAAPDSDPYLTAYFHVPWATPLPIPRCPYTWDNRDGYKDYMR